MKNSGWFLGLLVFASFFAERCGPGESIPEQEVRLIAHAGGGLNGRNYTNSVEALDANYSAGHRFFELDFNWTSDSQLILLHDWPDGYLEPHQTSEIPTLENFIKFDPGGGFHRMTLRDLLDWMGKNEGSFVVTDIKGSNLRGLAQIKANAGSAFERFIPQIYEPREYQPTVDMNYKMIIFTLYRSSATNKRVLDFVKNASLFSVTMPIGRAAPKRFAWKIHKLRRTTKKKLNRLRKVGVSGFYTDVLVPQREAN